MYLNAFPKAKSAGFTLTELVIAVMVLGVLVSLGMPSFLQMLRNSEIRAAAESVANGLQRARAEAVSRNARVQFVLGAGTSWTVDYVSLPGPTASPLDSRASTEGSTNATLTALALNPGTGVVDAGSPAATTITFNQLGQVVANADASQPLARVNFAATGGNQSLRVTIGAGGNARVCDPSLPSSNVRAC